MSAPSSLAALAERWRLSDDQVARVALVLDTLAHDPLAPTSIRVERALDAHIADSLTALELDCVARARTVADLGSGAGFPGVVLAIALPQADVALVESASRKCAFLERLCASAGVANARVIHARVEAWAPGLGVHDLVVARALAPLAVLCEYAAPLLALGGSLVAWKGAVSAAEAEAGARAAPMLGLRARGAVRTTPYAGSMAHHLHRFEKVAATPPGYPRRPGMARKHPLGDPL